MEQNVVMRSSDVEKARLMTRLSIIGAFTSGGLLILAVVLGVIKTKFAGSDVFALSVIPFALALLFSFGAVIYGMLANSAALEEEEKKLLLKRAESRALDVEEDVRFTAGRSFENYRRFAPYVLSLLAAALMILFLCLFYNNWVTRAAKVTAANPLHGTVVAALMTFAGIFAGAFFIGQSRQTGYRWLRPVGAWLAAGFGVMFAAMVVGIFATQQIFSADTYVAKVIFWIFAVLGVEFITNFIIEFYRPRTTREGRPVFESRLLSLFTEPGGVMRNIALTLDYQFGFKVSGTWIYSFLEKSFFPLVLFWLVMLWGFTMIHEVGPNQYGIRIALGRIMNPDKLLTPGIYWTLPWPFGTIDRYSCTEIKEIVVGAYKEENSASPAADDGHGHKKAAPKKNAELSQVVLWTAGHGASEENFIVAVPDSRKIKAEETNATPIDFIRVQLPIQYRIRPDGVFKYAFKNCDAERTIKFIGQQAVTEYLASASMMALMSTHRTEAQNAIARRVQQLADEHELGIEIVAVTLMDSHPPIEKVAPAFQSVIGAMEEKESIILKSKTYAATRMPEAAAQAARVVADAKSYQYKVTTVSKAEAGRFTTQLGTYRAMPSMFKLRSYLDLLEKDCRDIRKFVVASGLSNEVYELNFEQKERLDLVDTDINKLNN